MAMACQSKMYRMLFAYSEVIICIPVGLPSFYNMLYYEAPRLSLPDSKSSSLDTKQEPRCSLGFLL